MGKLTEYRRESPEITEEIEDGLEYYWGFFDKLEDDRADRLANAIVAALLR